MKDEKQPTSEPKTSPRLNESLSCDVCGRFGAYRFGERALCQDCYTGSGSCCPEFGKDDLWEFQDEASAASAQPGSQSSQRK